MAMGSDDPDPDGKADREELYFEDLPDGSGCTEIWEYLSHRREAQADGD